jgi:hypothetical protein
VALGITKNLVDDNDAATTMKSSLKTRSSKATTACCKSVRFAVDAQAKHGIVEVIVPSDGFLTVQERVLGWYNGRNYQVFKTSRRNTADEVRHGGHDQHAEYRTLFSKVCKACTVATTNQDGGDITGGGGWQARPHETEVAPAHVHTATKSALILAQSRFRGLERCIFPELLMLPRTAAIRAVVAFAQGTSTPTTAQNATTMSSSSSPLDMVHERSLAIAHMAQQQSLPFRRLARLQATGDALLVAIWDRLAAKAAAAAAVAASSSSLEPVVVMVDSVLHSTLKVAASDISEDPTESTVNSDDSNRSDDDDEVPYDEEISDCNSNDNSDPLPTTTTTALSNSFHSLIVSSSARRAKSLMQTRCSLMA